LKFDWTRLLPGGQTVERLLFGILVIVGYVLVVWYGASGKAEAKEASQIVHDAMLALGPLVGVVIYSVFKADKPADDTSPSPKSPTNPQTPPETT
jgi:hypothetical protein